MIDKKLTLQIGGCLKNEPKIKLAYVLGSLVSGIAKKDSDFDLVVVLDNKNEISLDHVYNLVSGLNFPRGLDLSIVDKNSPPLFLFQIISNGVCIYKQLEKERVSFEAFVLKNYYDSAHLRKIYYSYLKQKFPYANQ